MIDSKILVSVVIVLLIGVAAAGYQISSTTPGLWQPVTSTNPDTSQDASVSTGTDSSQQSSASSVSTSGSKSSGSGGASVKISASEAKSIAKNYIKQEGATAGTAKLITSNGKQIYLVPILMNGDQVGEIYIDPQTGDNLGGAGGAP